MSKRRNARDRKLEREKAKRSRQIQTGLIAGVLIMLIVGVVLVMGNQNSMIQISDEFADLPEPFLGNEDAEVTLIEYGAYGCHACQEWHEAGIVDALLEEFGERIKVVYRDLPIIDPGYSQMASGVAQCGQEQGNEAFWQMHNAIFEHAEQGRSSQNDLINLGVQVGLDEAQLRECVQEDRFRDVINYDWQRGQQLGLRGTPAWLVNDQVVYAGNPGHIRDAIIAALAATNS